MATTRYTGRWSRGQRFTPPAGDNPNLGGGIRQEHMDPVAGRTGFEEPTPRLPETPSSLYAADDFMLPLVLIGPVPMANEPEGHDVGGVTRGRTLLAGQAAAAAAHSRDYGSADVQMFEAPIMREDGAVYQTQRLEAERAVAGSRAALTRGRNSLPENNPDGPPDQGHYTMRWIDRAFKRRGIRTDQQPLRNYRAATANPIPAPAAAAANQYTSPYAALANARRLKLTTPQIRRVPRAPDEAAEVDGSNDPQYSDPQYWTEW